ncbi:MAG: hypothetical protein ABWK01_02505 [Infirmifilum sp.]
MPSKRKKEEKQTSNVDLTAFLTPQPEKTVKSEAQEAEEAKGKAYLTSEVEERILQLLNSEPSGLSRNQLYEWSKKEGIKAATFYQALTSLVEKGLVNRSFDPERQEYIFKIAK